MIAKDTDIEYLKQTDILYVEDDLNLLNAYRKYFEELFFHVYTSQDGHEAFQIFQRHLPRTVIIDINIPYIDGFKLSSMIKEVEKNTKIIFLTAQNDKETLLKAIELNVFSFLEKPVSRNDLDKKLKKLNDELAANDKIYHLLWKDEDYESYWYNSRRILITNHEQFKLTKKEAMLLNYLILNKNRTVSYEELYDAVWMENLDKEISITAIKNVIRVLRKKVPENTIRSDYGIGFYIVM